MKNEQLNGFFEIIEIILNKKPSIVDSFLFDSLEYYIEVYYPNTTDEIDSLVDDIIDICSEVTSGDDCSNERKELEKIYNKIKSRLIFESK
ncbi:hypothetical protein ABID14_000223 [Peptoniphilus olsenii]|uniref:Colicin D immunity protein domain-containing protein n=1 Tax=Peptoniphilus olsenii TaxID=411570 RepID=A0ABV2J749_9FIRM